MNRKLILAQFEIDIPDEYPSDHMIKLISDYISLCRFTTNLYKVEAYPPHYKLHTFGTPHPEKVDG